MTATAYGCGPPTRVDGPRPIRPPYGLLQAAENPAAGVQIVPEPDDQYLNGVEVYPYPPGPANAWNPYATGTAKVAKDDGTAVTIPAPFGAFPVVLAETCSAVGIPSQAEFVARAEAAFAAVEGAGVAAEFMSGNLVKSNPHLADGNGTFPNNDAPTSVLNALALLEDYLGETGKQGLIHLSPGMAVSLKGGGALELDLRGGVWRTVNGTVVVADAGYAAGARPAGHAGATGANQAWIFATGPVDIRRTETVLLPGRVEEALDRGDLGATRGRPNSITYRVERYYVVDWDGQAQAAVLADRCRANTSC